ncbi:MAG TPA: Rieske 2Fe-2S domain-containing protein [Chloroflexota bacterium]|nr:Rieske 2Fe-2S domain-containing protein [Chloroflexota bacterium]
MLTREENELLTRTGPGTPMGQLLRRYWLPALLSEELPEPDGRPVRLPLLGERLVAYRDATGQVGLLEEACPHRGASLALGRNEDGALRCLYHGWQFDRSGRCTDMPTERPGSPFRERVRAQAYPTREAAGIVWAYLGPPDRLPPFPAYEWMGLPAEQQRVWKLLHECNYLQALERDVNLAHVRIAHRTLSEREMAAGARLADLDRQDTVPDVDVEPTRYGFRYAAIYRPDEPLHQVRVGAFVAPCLLFLGPIGEHCVAMAFVPRDDESNWHFLVRYNVAGPVDAATYAATRGVAEVGPDFRKRRNRDNDYLQDRAAMQRSFNGIAGVIVEDHALAELQGPIVDRTRETLTATDAPIVALRDLLLRHAGQFAAGQEPALPGLDPALPFGAIGGATLTKPAQTPWREAAPLPPGLALPAAPAPH